MAPVSLEALNKIVGFLKGDTHSGKDNDKGIVGTAHLGLARNLCGQLGMGQTAGGEDRKLLSAHQSVQAVNGGDAGLNEFLRIIPGGGVHGQAIDICAAVGQDIRAAVNRAAQTVKDSSQHIFTDAQFHTAA